MILAAMNAARHSMGVAVLDVKMYAVGGYDGVDTLSSLECFDPLMGQWSMILAAMNTARHSRGVAVLEWKMYAVGGYDGDLAHMY